MIDFLATNVTVAGLGAISARVLEQYAWFQRLTKDTKRFIAVLFATLIALTIQMISAMLQNTEPQTFKVVFSTVLANVVQQTYHALTKQDAQ
jgi:hypothetical protein